MRLNAVTVLHARGFLLSVAIGAAILTFLPSIVTITIGFQLILGGEIGTGLLVMFLPFLTAAAVIGIASITSGALLTLLLAKFRKESGAAYFLASMLLGAMTMYAIGLFGGNYWYQVDWFICVFGMAGGAITGSIWWFTTRSKMQPPLPIDA